MNKIPQNNESALEKSSDQSNNDKSRSIKPQDDTIDRITKEIEKKLGSQPDISNLNETIIKKGVDNTVERINNINEILDQVDNSNFFGYLGLYEELINFGKTLPANVEKEFNEIISLINNKDKEAMEFIPVLFIFSVLKNSSVVSEKIFQEFKDNVKLIIEINDYKFSDDTKLMLKKNRKAIEQCLLILLNKKYENFAHEFLNQTSYVAYDDKLILEGVKNKHYSFLKLLLKKSKSGFFSHHEESGIKTINQHTKNSIVSSFKDLIQSQLSIKQEKLQNQKERKQKQKKIIHSEIDIINSNKLILQVLEDGNENVAIKIMFYYSLKYSKDFLIPKTLYFSIEKNYFLFFKKYFDIYPFSHFNILNFNTILKAIKMINSRDSFVHSIFLLTKINAVTLSEIHVRLILDQLEILWNKNLFFFTYTINPILMCVLICEICYKMSQIFTNVKVRLDIESTNFLQLAKLIKDQINDELFIKTIYLRKFYPADKTLLQLLYFRRNFYAPLLKSDLISEIVEDLWYCDYYHTYNIFNTSSAYQNLKGKLYITENINSNLISSSANSSPTYSPSFKATITSFQNTPPTIQNKNNYDQNQNNLNISHNDENITKLNQLKNINFKTPFQFIRSSNTFDYKFTNHVFSYFFWQKSPSYRVILESLIYVLFFILIVQNAFESFRLRRIFIGFPKSILILIDTFIGLKHGDAPPLEFYSIIKPWMIANKVSDPRIAIYMASLQPTYCDGLVMFIPEFKPSCGIYAEASENFWDLADKFITNQFFFYFTMLGTLLEIIYTFLIQKKIWFNAKIIIDFVITGTNIYIQYIYFTKIDGKYLMVRHEMLEYYALVETNMLVFVFLMWLKFFIYLKLTKTFGYVIKVIEIMTIDLLDFLVIFSIIILAFSLIIYDLLSESHENFSSLIMTIRSLLFITYGEVFFEGFKDNETLGTILITIFSIISVIILLSLLVAILNNTYKTIFDRSNLENASIFYTNYLARRPDKYRSALISFPPPANILIIPFIPLLIIKKSSRLNHFICMSGYGLFVILYMSIYIVGNIFIIIPLCWLKYIISIYINVITRSRILKSYLLIIFWGFTGLFYLIYIFFTNDLYHFWQSLFNHSKNRDCLDEITLEEIELVKKTAIKLTGSKVSITYNEFYDAIRNDLDILNKKIRKTQLQLKAKTKETVSNKMNQLNIFKSYSENKYINNSPSVPNSAKKNMEKNLRQFIEIDKMEVFSLIRQFAGIDSNILLIRMISLLEMLKYCKKLHIIPLNRIKKIKISNFVQIIDVLATERAVLGILAGNLKSMEHLEIVKNHGLGNKFENLINEKEKMEMIRSNSSFVNEILKFTASKRKSTIDQNEKNYSNETPGNIEVKI